MEVNNNNIDCQEDTSLIKTFALREDLKCYDPYDVWMTSFGIKVKELYNANKWLGILPAATLTVWDNFLNNNTRFFYNKQEYPTTRAMAALTLLNSYELNEKQEFINGAKSHIDWLIKNSCKGYSGLCWGLGFKWAAGDDLDYDENTPFSTHTPYVLEALDTYISITGDVSYVPIVESIFSFYENDIQVMLEDERTMATSYGPDKDRLVTNAVSYTMFAYALFLKYIPNQKSKIEVKILKLYNYIKSKQLKDGAWMYEPDSEDSFIDCFHSCFVLKNIYKTTRIFSLDDSNAILEIGYEYVKKNFYSSEKGLFKRFSLSNKPSIVKFDLYDNAEMLQLAVLFNDTPLILSLSESIKNTFVRKNNIYTVIDIFNLKRNKNTLRWAVMPYLYALSIKNKLM